MKFLRLLALLLAIAGSAQAAQYDPVLPTTSPYPGLTMLSNINSSFQGILSQNSGASAPTYEIEGTAYVNTSSSLYEFYSGSNWLNVGTFSGTQWASVNNGVPYTIPASTGSSNAYVVTYSPAPTAYVTGQHYPFISNFANTTTASENVNGLGAKQITKNGQTALVGAEIGNPMVVDTVYDGTYMEMLSQQAVSNSGTVTSIATNNGITGGTITGTGTIGLASQSNLTILSNIGGSTAPPTGNSISAILDATTTNVQGGILYRGASVWNSLYSSTSGVVFSQGASANPIITNAPTLANLAVSGTTTTANLSVSGTCSGCGGFGSQNVVTGSRTCGTVYHNTTGKTMFVTISIEVIGGSPQFQSDSSSSPSTVIGYPSGVNSNVAPSNSFMVLAGNYYEMTGSCTTNVWVEYY